LYYNFGKVCKLRLKVLSFGDILTDRLIYNKLLLGYLLAYLILISLSLLDIIFIRRTDLTEDYILERSIVFFKGGVDVAKVGLFLNRAAIIATYSILDPTSKANSRRYLRPRLVPIVPVLLLGVFLLNLPNLRKFARVRRDTSSIGFVNRLY